MKPEDLGGTDDDGQQDEMWDLQNRLLGKQHNHRKGNVKFGEEMMEGYARRKKGQRKKRGKKGRRDDDEEW